jgi:hypothetical protein
MTANVANPAPTLPVVFKVTTRQFNLLEMVEREWGASYREPDHRIYAFGGGKRFFDSTDMGFTGIYGPFGVSYTTPPQPGVLPPGSLLTDSGQPILTSSTGQPITISSGGGEEPFTAGSTVGAGSTRGAGE